MPSNKKLLQAAAGNAGESLYVEDVFSTYLYTGTGSAQTITNGIDLDGEGGLVWLKNRSTTQSHGLFDTERTNGASYFLSSDLTGAEYLDNGASMTFNSDGFALGSATYFGGSGSGNAQDYASWSFRKAEKFFDVVTWTGDGVAGREIAHNLGSVPAVIITKRYDASGAWWTVYHKNSPNSVGWLNETNAFDGNDMQYYYGNGSSAVTPTSSVFTVSDSANVNGSSATYVAYLFASDAGGFGDDDENIIKCGSYTGTGSAGLEVDLGFEPQWVLVKSTTSSSSNWLLMDVMRGMHNTGGAALFPNQSYAESNLSAYTSGYIVPTSTGFVINAVNNVNVNQNSGNYIYIAIRRPMKTPESGTEVFAPVNRTATAPTYNTGFVTDMQIMTLLNGFQNQLTDRLRGQKKLLTNATDAESAIGTEATYDWMTGVGDQDSASSNNIAWNFKRATGFFDVVAYTGNGSGSGQVINHNLGVTPEIIIIKGRSNSGRQWHTYVASQGQDKALFIESNGAEQANTALVGGTINSTQYELKVDFGNVNGNGETYISYLFATLAGVSKVGSYTGTGSDLNVDCGFSAGARFILIKRSDSTGDWYFWDSARGITAGNDPYLLLNTTAAEVTNTDYIDPLSSGFTVTSTAPAGLNASGGSYIFLAIA